MSACESRGLGIQVGGSLSGCLPGGDGGVQAQQWVALTLALVVTLRDMSEPSMIRQKGHS